MFFGGNKEQFAAKNTAMLAGAEPPELTPSTDPARESIPTKINPDKALFAPKDEIEINLSVGDSIYTAKIAEGSTAYDAMARFASTTAFNFKAKYYSGLGYFIEEIGGVKNSDGAYWTLYINGVYSTVGASTYILKDKDSLTWKFEKK